MRGSPCLLSLLLLCLVPRAQAADDSSALVEKYEASRKEIAEAESQKRRILGSLYGINQRMKKISHDKDHLTDELFQAQDNVKNIAKIISNLESQIQSERRLLRKRLRALYKLSGEGYMAIIFSRQDPQDLDRTMRFLKIVTDNDYHLIRAYQENIATYKAQKQKLRGQVEKLMTIEKNIKKQENLLLAEHHAKSKIVSSLDKQKVMHIHKLKTLRDRGQDMNLGDLLQPSIFEQKGQLAAPIQGSVVQDFGLVNDDKYKVRLAHKGWLYESAKGAQVSSIYEGTVLFSEEIEGYGHTIVLDHGDHYYSVYAHITRASVKTGDTIKKGQAIAEAGPIAGASPTVASEGRTSRADRENKEGIYFEIRHFSEPENPTGWIRHDSDKSSIAKGDT